VYSVAFYFCHLRNLYGYAIVSGKTISTETDLSGFEAAIFSIFPYGISAIVVSLNKTGFLTTFGRACNRPVYLYHKQKQKRIMKTKSLFFAAFVLVSSLAVAAGKDEPRNTGMAIVPVKGSETYKVIYKGETTGRVKLNIYNSASRVILTETFNSTQGFIVPVNFTGLEAGEYTIELIDASGKRIEKVIFGAIKPSKKIAHVSNIDKQNGKFLLSVANTTPGQEINVKIYDAQNNLLHNESRTVNANGDFATIYKLSPGSSSLTFEVSDNAGKIKTARF
jgi:hypothetical protein